MYAPVPSCCNYFQEKVDYGALIQELGGEYIDLDYFTTECSHLVVGRSKRSVVTAQCDSTFSL